MAELESGAEVDEEQAVKVFAAEIAQEKPKDETVVGKNRAVDRAATLRGDGGIFAAKTKKIEEEALQLHTFGMIALGRIELAL